MVFIVLWLLGAVIGFFWTYPGGLKEMKRDWCSYKNNFFIYLGAMLIGWTFMVAWKILRNADQSETTHKNHLKEVK